MVKLPTRSRPFLVPFFCSRCSSDTDCVTISDMIHSPLQESFSKLDRGASRTLLFLVARVDTSEEHSPHHAARVAGLRDKRTRLTTRTHSSPMAGERNRE